MKRYKTDGNTATDRFALAVGGNGWGIALEARFTAEQDRVADWLGETTASGYSVFNLASRWQLGAGELGF